MKFNKLRRVQKARLIRREHYRDGEDAGMGLVEISNRWGRKIISLARLAELMPLPKGNMRGDLNTQQQMASFNFWPLRLA